MKNKSFIRTIVLTALFVLVMGMTLTACGDKDSSGADDDSYDDIADDFDDDEEDSKDDLNTDIDLDALNKSIESIKNLDLGADTGNDAADEDVIGADDAADTDDTSADVPAGEKTVYSYADVYRDGNNLAVIPNGGLNSSTKPFNDKDLNGFLDYVDSTVLEAGRTINRDFFYDLMSIMLVDKDLSSDQTYIEKHMMVALAVANNFHDMPVKINECDLDANNATDYVCKVTAYDKDDTWIFNFAEDTLYMNNGATEYVSDMFKNEYMAVWMMAIEDYFGIS